MNMNTIKYVVLVSVFQGSSHLMICLPEAYEDMVVQKSEGEGVDKRDPSYMVGGM